MDLNDYRELVTRAIHAMPGEPIAAVIDRIEAAYMHGHTVFVVGNGGSAATASHFAQDLAKGVILDQGTQQRIRAMSLTDNVSYLTALANDNGYDHVFAAQLTTFARPSDVLIAISASGKSPNILEAAKLARGYGIDVIAVTGAAESPLRSYSQLEIVVPTVDVGVIEGVHSVILHYVTTALRARLEGSAPAPVQASIER